MADAPLAGFGVLVTRPREQARELIVAIEDAGGTAIQFPAIEVAPLPQAQIEAQLDAKASFDIAVFVSRNAVEFGHRHVNASRIAAVGPSTALALRAAGIKNVIAPEDGFDSESLLAHSALQDVARKRILIVRGGDGRELLATELRDRGADVSYLSAYVRRLPVVNEDDRERVSTAWQEGRLGAITVMSVATLHNLMKLLPEWCVSRLDSVSLVTPAARVIKEVLELYPSATPVLAAGPQAHDMLQAIISIHRNDSGHAS